MSLRKKLGVLAMGLGLLGLSANVNAEETKFSSKATKHSISFISVSKYVEPFDYNGQIYRLETREETAFWKNPKCAKGDNKWYNGEHLMTNIANAVKNHMIYMNDFDCDGEVDHIFSPDLGINFYRSKIDEVKDMEEKERRKNLFIYGDIHLKKTKQELDQNGLMKKTIDAWLKSLK